LRIDQEKEREKMEEERLLLEEKERIQAEELRKRKEEEETEQNHELLYQNLKRRFDEKEKSDLATGDRKQVRLALRLANGERVQRNFFVDEQLEEVQLYTTMKLLEKDRSANINFVFVSDFPRRVFRNFAGTLEECELDRPTLLNVSPE
jgi:FAS-associated factor 2